MIGKLNRRVTLKSWSSTQDEAGGVIPLITSTYVIWANVEDRTGHIMQGEQQRQWSYDYKVTFRYEKSRVVTSGMTIDYDSKRLAINSLSYENEGQRRYCIARCSTTDITPVYTGGSPDIIPSYYGLNILFRVGDEGWPADGDTEYTLPQIVGLDWDKFTVFRNGLPMWHTEFTFDSATGKITLIVPGDKFNQGEQFLIK